MRVRRNKRTQFQRQINLPSDAREAWRLSSSRSAADFVGVDTGVLEDFRHDIGIDVDCVTRDHRGAPAIIPIEDVATLLSDDIETGFTQNAMDLAVGQRRDFWNHGHSRFYGDVFDGDSCHGRRALDLKVQLDGLADVGESFRLGSSLSVAAW